MKTLVFLLEEPSAQAMLEGLLPRFLPEGVLPKYIVFEGKQDLEKQLERKLRGWRTPNTHFVVLRDQDSGNCLTIKERLLKQCHNAGRSDALVRIACRELESFYLGDLCAVEAGLGIHGLANKQDARKFRNPDRLENPSQELVLLTNKRYQKVSGSRAIGKALALQGNRSRSFSVLLQGIRGLIDSPAP